MKLRHFGRALLILTLTAGGASWAQPPATPTADGRPGGQSRLEMAGHVSAQTGTLIVPANGTTLIAAPADLNPTSGSVPEPIAVSVLPVTCYSTCNNGSSSVGSCGLTLELCCASSRRLYCAHFGGGYFAGYCTDGASSLVC